VFSRSPGFEWLYDDFICVQQNRSHGALHVGVAADQQGKRVRLGMARGANPGKDQHLGLSNSEQPPENLDGTLNGPWERPNVRELRTVEPQSQGQNPQGDFSGDLYDFRNGGKRDSR
jgi:hypothetical protein